MNGLQADAYASYQHTGEGADYGQPQTSPSVPYQQQHTPHSSFRRHYAQENAFNAPERSSHTEAQRALETVAADFRARHTLPKSSTSNSTGRDQHEAAASAAAAGASASASASNSEPSSPSGASATPFATHLGRNKACQSCRARKLKCDGQKPVCGQCAKGWQIKFRMAQNKAKSKKKSDSLADPEGSEIHMPACIFLPKAQRGASGTSVVLGQNDDSVDSVSPQAGPSTSATAGIHTHRKRKRLDERTDNQVARMQQEIDHLKSQLAQVTASELANALHQHHVHQQPQDGNTANQRPSNDELAIAHLLATSMPSGEDQSPTAFDFQQQNVPVDLAAATSVSRVNGLIALEPNLRTSAAAVTSLGTSSNGYPPTHAAHARTPLNVSVSEVQDDMEQEYASPLLELMMTSWPADFPPPNLVTQLVHTYFEKTTAQSLFIHPAKFMENLSLGPQHPRFPSRGVLHGIFAHAYPRMRPSDISHLPQEMFSAGRPTVTADKRDSVKTAAAFHAKRAQAQIQKACSEGSFEEAAQIQALLVAYHYINDQSFEAWMSSGGYSSLTKGMELNRLAPIRSYGQRLPEDRQSADQGRRVKPSVYRATIKPPAATALEHEERIRLFWNCFYSDRAACSSTHWAQNIDDLDIKTELPGAFDDFINASPDLVYRPRQTFESPNLFTEMHYDPAILHLKAAILHSRCVSHMSRLDLDASVASVISPNFHQLDYTIGAMLQSVPMKWRELSSFDPMLQAWGSSEPTYLHDGVNNRPSKQISLMTNQLVMAHALMHGSAISLHEPVAHHVPDSAIKAARAAHSIIGIIKTFVAARVDLLQVGSLLTLMIVLAARSIARQYKKAKKEATLLYVKLKQAHPERFVRSATTSPAAEASYASSHGNLDNMDPEPPLFSAGNKTAPIEDEMESALDYDPSLRAQLDPDSHLTCLRDDLELIFWSLVKYGETYALGVGQAKVVAQLLGKDYSSELEQSGLFKKMAGSGRGSSVARSTSDTGSSWNDPSLSNGGAPRNASLLPQRPQQQQPHIQQQPYPPQYQQQQQQQHQQAWNAGPDYHSSHRPNSLYLDQTSISTYYPAAPSHIDGQL